MRKDARGVGGHALARCIHPFHPIASCDSKTFSGPSGLNATSVSFLSTAFVLFLLFIYFINQSLQPMLPHQARQVRKSGSRSSPSPSVPHTDTRPEPPFRSRALSFHSLGVLMDHITESHSSYTYNE